jgi:hypothetical protein
MLNEAEQDVRPLRDLDIHESEAMYPLRLFSLAADDELLISKLGAWRGEHSGSMLIAELMRFISTRRGVGPTASPSL